MSLPKWMQSSADAEKLSLTIKGFLTGIIPVILLFNNVTNLHLTKTDLDGAIDAIITVILVIPTVIGSVLFLIGLIRKVANWEHK